MKCNYCYVDGKGRAMYSDVDEHRISLMESCSLDREERNVTFFRSDNIVIIIVMIVVMPKCVAAEIGLAAGITLGAAAVGLGLWSYAQDGRGLCHPAGGATQCPRVVDGPR